ncbi:General control protein [Parahypoxylon ruwenzoriense]
MTHTFPRERNYHDSSSSLPAPPAQSNFPQQQLQQDFVLFDLSPPQRQNVNRTVSSPASAAAFGSLHANRSHSSHLSHGSASPSLQNQRVAQIIQATGHQTSSSTAFTNRFNSHAQNQNQHQFFASLSAPPSTAAVNQQNRPARPPVPLFTQGIGSQQNPAKMDLQGNWSDSASSSIFISHATDALSLEDFTAFEGGATTAYSSPGVPGYDLNVSSASSNASNMGTVSPQDLLIHEPFASAPNSAAITNLTSPSIYNESPEFHDNYEVSPNFGSSDFDHGSNDHWYSLFPQENTVTEPAPATPAVDESPAPPSEELEIVETTSQPRRKPGNSPPSGAHGRHSSVTGVNSRRRDKPLPPIVIDDPNDTVAMKRARNTLAARKSRERKAQRLEELEEKIAKLEQERDHWKRIALQKSG